MSQSLHNQSQTATLNTQIIGLLRTMRPRQWAKNGAIYAALIFDGKLFQPELLLRTTLVCLCFCLVASCVYIMNDLVDIEKDRQHPRKRLRALPSGQLNPALAKVAAVLLALIAVPASYWISPWAGLVTASYLLLNVAYSFYLKNVVLIEAMIVAVFFLQRVQVGVFAVEVENFSPWLYVCVALGALFLVFGKRRHEISLLEGNASKHRASLEQYNLPLLDQIINMVTTSLLMAYTLYSFEAETALVSDGRMLLTVPFVFYFIVRYLYLIHVKKLGGAPDELVFKDRPLLVNCLCGGMVIVGLLYFF